MEEDIKVLEDMRDNIYGTIQFEDDYEVRALEQKQFDALNLAIKHLRKTKLVHSQFIPKSKVREKMDKDINTNEHTILGGRRNGKTLEYGIRLGRIQMCEELLQEGDK